MSKKDIINHVIEIEGGYVDDPSDSGGETNYGITKAVARRYGYAGHMRDLPREVAYQIYEANSFENEIIIAGIQGNGIFFAKELVKYLQKISSLKIILFISTKWTVLKKILVYFWSFLLN